MTSPHSRRKLKAKAHHLKPVILLGEKGVTANVLAEIERALDDHELIKIKIPSADQASFQEEVAAICEATKAEQIQTVGHILVLYRRSNKD